VPEAPLTEVDDAARDEPTAGGDPGATAIPEGPGLPVTADDSAAQEAFGVSTSDRPDGADGDRRHRRPRRPDPWWRQVVEWVAVAAVALLIAVVLRTFVVQTFYVPSGSMLPTLQIGDRIIVNKLYGPVHRFDIIVFRRTPEDTSTTDADLVKRVIGLPGETIWSRGDTIYVNGKAINESWLPTTTGSSCPQAAYDIQKTHIPANDYFVMGDCRGNSEDSRAWGFVPSTYIVGKVFVVVWRHGHPWLHWF
jgi:signal peptidase I